MVEFGIDEEFGRGEIGSLCALVSWKKHVLLVKFSPPSHLFFKRKAKKREKLDNVYAFVHLNSICHAHFCIISGVRPWL